MHRFLYLSCRLKHLSCKSDAKECAVKLFMSPKCASDHLTCTYIHLKSRYNHFSKIIEPKRSSVPWLRYLRLPISSPNLQVLTVPYYTIPLPQSEAPLSTCQVAVNCRLRQLNIS